MVTAFAGPTIADANANAALRPPVPIQLKTFLMVPSSSSNRKFLASATGRETAGQAILVLAQTLVQDMCLTKKPS
jgi:hypothetical protein